MLPLLIFLLAQVISPQVDVVESPKGEKEGMETSADFSSKDWTRFIFEFTNTPKEWENLAGVTITVSVECSTDKGSVYRISPNKFVAGTLGPLGDGMPRITVQQGREETCKVNVEPDKKAEIGWQLRK